MKIALLATYPKRYDSLREMLPTILGQVDKIYIYCNQYSTEDYSKLLAWINKVGAGEIVSLILEDEVIGNIRDMGKFYSACYQRGYIFLIDDDLIYPFDYAKKMCKYVDELKTICTVHGRNFKQLPVEDYYLNTQSFHYKRSYSNPVKVSIAGTGTVCFHTNHFRIPKIMNADLKFYSGIADIFFAIRAMADKKEIYVVPRPLNWIDNTPSSNMAQSLYLQNKENMPRINRMINLNFP